MLCLAVPLLIGLLTGHPAEGAQASFGGLAGLYVPDSPYRYRARVVAAVGAGLTLAVFLGAVTGSFGWVAALVAGVFAGGASFICQAVELSPPREIMFIMALLAATAIPADAAQALLRAAVTGAGAGLAWLISMSPALFNRDRPETTTIAAALAGIADLVDRIGSGNEPAARHTAVNGVRRARLAMEQAGRTEHHRLTRIVESTEGLLEAALRSTVEETSPRHPALAVAIRAQIPLIAARSDPENVTDEPIQPQSPDPLARAIEDLHSAVIGGPVNLTNEPAPGRPPSQPGLVARLRAAAGQHSVIIPTSARIGIAVGAGFGIGLAFGIAHAFWIGLTACAVLQASNLRVIRSRVVYRVVGTILGIGLVYALLAWNPPMIVLIVTAILAQGLIESVIPAHYGLAVIGITVLSLMLFHLGAPGEDTSVLIGARLIDTALGAALALLLRTVLWRNATSARVPPRQATVLDSIGHVFAAIWTPDHRNLPERRRQLLADITALRVVQDDALADTSRATAATDLGWPITVATEKLAYIAYSAPVQRPAPTPREAHTFLTGLRQLAVGVTDRTTPLTPAPVLPAYPRTSHAISSLTEAIAQARRSPTAPGPEQRRGPSDNPPR
jgi:uncharacterized membrane protein YccC